MRPHGLPRVQLRIPLCRPDGPSRQGGRAVLAAPQVARGHARGLEGLAARGEEGGLEGGEGGLALDHVPVVGIEAGQVYLVASLVVDVDVCVSMYHVSQVHHAVESREGGGDGDEAPHKHRRRDQRPYRLHLEPSDGNGGSDVRDGNQGCVWLYRTQLHRLAVTNTPKQATIVSAERRKSGLCCFSITATARSREPEPEPVGREGGNLTIPRTSMDGASPGGGAEQRELVAVDHREGGDGDN